MKKLILLLFCSFLVMSCSTKNFDFKRLYNFSQPEPVSKPHNLKVALVLGGGGARAFAHIGVLEELEKANIPIDLIVGTSGGSIVGALYSDRKDVQYLKDNLLDLKKWDFLDCSLVTALQGAYSLEGTTSGDISEEFLNKNLNAKYFKQLQIPFVAVSTDLNTGETVAIDSGPIVPAVRASYSIPGIFSPVELYGKTLVDGGVSDPMAIDVAKEYNPGLIIAVDVGSGIEKNEVTNMIEAMFRALEIVHDRLNRKIAKDADILIAPDVQHIGMFSDEHNEELYQAGKRAARDSISKIRKALAAREQ